MVNPVRLLRMVYKNMKKRNVVITGANSGIGKAAAIHFAREGYAVIMACRNMVTGEASREEVVRQTGNSHVELMPLDISSPESAGHFGRLLREKFESLDILIHNAGRFHHGLNQYMVNSEGVEMIFAVNTLGPYRLTEMLLPLLKVSGNPKVLHACSTNIKHFLDPAREIDYHLIKASGSAHSSFNAYKMYGDSKMGLLLLTYRMAEEYRKYGIKVNALLIPGTRLSKETLRKNSLKYRIAAAVMNPFWPGPEAIAANYFHICTSQEFDQVTGQLINNKNRILPLPDYPGKMDFRTNVRELMHMSHAPMYAARPEHVDRMWQTCRELTGQEQEL